MDICDGSRLVGEAMGLLTWVEVKVQWARPGRVCGLYNGLGLDFTKWLFAKKINYMRVFINKKYI